MKFIKKNLFLIIMILLILALCFFKQGLVRNLPILANAGAVEDDELMVRHALTILDGNWLGNYSYNTLIKNVFFSIFLALCKVMSVSYINAITLLYSISCIIFILGISKKVSNKSVLLIIFALLLFNPIMFSKEAMQRVYRNSLIPSFALMITGSYIGMFLYREDKFIKYAFFSIISIIVIPCFYYTREDSMWLVPYIVFMSVAIVIALLVKFFKDKQYCKKNIILLVSKIIFLIFPVITTSLFGKYISNKNLEYYNTKIICTQTTHSKLMGTIYSIKPNKEIYRVNNPKEKLERMAEVSPTFKSIKPELDKMMVYFENKKTGEVENGLFMWPLITAISNAGYNTPEKEQEIMEKITLELEDAMDKGLLERQGVMPVLGGPVLTKQGYKDWFNTILEGAIFLGDYDNVKIVSSIKSTFYPGLDSYMDEFKKITGNRVLFEEGSKDINGNLLVELQDQDEYLKSIEDELKILSNIKTAYRYIAIFIEILGIASYIFITIYVLINLIKKKIKLLDDWIIMSGIIGAIFTLLVGVAYVHITQTNAIVHLYLAGAFPLVIAFSVISIYSISRIIISKTKKFQK